MSTGKYEMTISRMTVDKLGMKLYDRVSAVIAELVANGYDADAEIVTIEAPMNTYLATPRQGQVRDQGHTIVVEDDGNGMLPDEINPFYLKVGGERRKDSLRGDTSPKFGRRVMGRKGVGKLAPFGICNRIEVISSGGEPVDGKDENENEVKNGYRTAHFIMERDDILQDEDFKYQPTVGDLDETVQPKHGTKIIMSEFIHRKVPDLDTFGRQLSQRFGVSTKNWQIKMVDSTSPDSQAVRVGEFEVDTMPKTKISLGDPSANSEAVALEELSDSDFAVVDEEGKSPSGISAGFSHNGTFYPLLGWVAYSKKPYRDDLMAGIRIYCRGKIAAQTSVFNRKSGFTGEYNIRSYLVGELHADWLDQDEDLIQTDRRDILWSDDLGVAFEAWGQKIVEYIGTISREPMRKKTWEQFLEVSKIDEKIESAYPGDTWISVRDTTRRLAQMMGERLRPNEVEDQGYVDSLVDLSLMLGPHVQLEKSLHEAAASDEETPISALTGILRTARVAELSSYGAIAEGRVRVIERINSLIGGGSSTVEDDLQKLISGSPWLINPLWSPITSNQALSTLKWAFETHYKDRTGEEISLSDFSESGKRPDFVLSADDFGIQIIEIKRPQHTLSNVEWERIQMYINQMEAFLDDPGNSGFKDTFKRFTVTVVCDSVGLSGSQKKAFDSYVEEKLVEQITWRGFLLRTKQMHKDFLEEAKRQRELETKSE